MNKDWKDGYNFALKEIRQFICFLLGDSGEAISFRANNGSKGVTDELLKYLTNRERI